MGVWGPDNEQTIVYLDRNQSSRPLTSYRIIPIDLCFRHRGCNEFDECVFAYGRFHGSQIERCAFLPRNLVLSSDQLVERWCEEDPDPVVIARGSLSPREMRFDVTPVESTIEELVVRSFAARQTRDYGNYAQARVYLQDTPYGLGYTITELLKLYGYVVPTLQ